MDESTFSSVRYPGRPASGQPKLWWKRFARCAAALLLAVILAALVLGTAAAQGPLDNLVRITIASDSATRDSQNPAIDAGGTHIAFESDSDLLGQGIVDGQFEIWLHDTQTMTHTRITTASDGATRDSGNATIDANSTRVVFESDSDFLGQGIADNRFEIWLYDVQAANYTRITTASNSATRDSGNAAISADGNWIVFESDSDFLGQGIADDQFEVWLYSVGTGILTRVTTASDGATRDSRYPAISADGNWIVFESDSDFQSQGIADDQIEVWLYNVGAGTLTRITTSSDPTNRDSRYPTISADGNRIVFESDSDFQSQGIVDNQFEIWLYDVQAAAYTQITTASAADRASGNAAISADGTQIVLVSDSDLLGEAIVNNQFEVWLYDLLTLEYTRLTTLSDPATRTNYYPAINGDGARVVFFSDADFLGQGIANDQYEVWLSTTAPELVLTKTIAADPEVAGTGTVYTVTITNQGVVTAENVTLSDTLHLSTTLTTVDQTDDDNSALGFGGGAHSNTEWVDGRPGLDGDEWLQMADPGLGSGEFTSRIVDAGYVGAWDQLAWRPERPYGQPLPDNGGSETLYPLGNADMVGNRVLLHLEDAGAPFADTSGQGHDGECTDCPATGASGRFGDALVFDGVDDAVIIPDPVDPVRYAVELWVYPTLITDTSLILRTDTLSGTEVNYSHLLGISGGQFVHCTRAPGLVCAAGTTVVQPDMWYHIVGTAESNGDIKLFVNGQEEGRVNEIGALWTGGDEYRLGAPYGAPGTTAPFAGRIDEVAVYSRTLSSGEVRDHYLRGALRLSFQARSCANPDCSDGTWNGPYIDQPGGGSSAPLILPANRYFQYQVTFESDDPAASPRLAWVNIDPDHWIVQANQGSCDPQAGQFTCALGTLAPGQVTTVTFPAHIDPSMLGLITNTAAVTTSTPGDMAAGNTAIATTTVVSEVRLEVFKYDDERDLPEWAPVDPDSYDPVNPNAPLTYTLAVHNGGPSTAWTVTLTDTMPVDIEGFDAPADWSCETDGQALTCTVPGLAVYAWQYFTLYGTAPAGEGMITNTAAITAAGSTVYDDPDRTAVETTTVTPLADVWIAKSAYPDPIEPGAGFTYLITVTNAGPSPASQVTIIDTLPAGMTAVPSGCSGGNPAICTVLNMPAGAMVVFAIPVNGTPTTGVVVNHARVFADTVDPDEQNNEITLYTAIRRVADLEIDKVVEPDPVSAGGTLTYTITLTNTGPAAAGEMTTLVSLQSHATIPIPIGGRGRPYPSTIALSGVDGQTRDVTVTLSGLEHTYPADLVLLLVGPGGRNVILMANAGGGVDAAGVDVVLNDAGEPLPMSGALDPATVYRPTNYGLGEDLPADAPAGPYGGSLSAFAGASPNGVWQLYVYDTFDSDGGRIAGWSLDIAAVTADAITVTDTLPPGLTGTAAAAPAGWQCSTGGGAVTCQGEYLEVDGQAVLTLSASAPITGGTIANTATVTATVADDDLTDNTATVTHTVRASADLAIVKSASVYTVAPAAPLQYTLAVSNIGPSPLAGVVTVTDQLPAGLSGVSAAGTGWTCNRVLSLLTCTRSGLSLGAAPSILVSAGAPAATGWITNTAWITSAVNDPQPGNNTTSATVYVTRTVSGSAIYLPLVMRNWTNAPDLVVESIQVSANAIQVVVRNVGAQAVARAFENEFWVDVYINPSRAPAAVNETWQHLCTRGVVWGVTQGALPLNVGQALTLTVTPAGGTYYDPALSRITWPLAAGTVVYAQVDSAHEQTTYGAVRENHEYVGGPYNNISGPVLVQ